MSSRLFDRAMAPGEGFEPADLVVSNAGNNQHIDFRELTAAQFEDFWRVGCFSGFLVGREAARRLVPLGRGTVIFTGASASIRGKPGFAHFSAAKAGLRMISQSMAREYGPARYSCGPRRGGWRDRWRTPSDEGAAAARRARRGRPARHRRDRRDLLAHPSAAAVGLDAGSRPAPVQGKVLKETIAAGRDRRIACRPRHECLWAGAVLHSLLLSAMKNSRSTNRYGPGGYAGLVSGIANARSRTSSSLIFGLASAIQATTGAQARLTRGRPA